MAAISSLNHTDLPKNASPSSSAERQTPEVLDPIHGISMSIFFFILVLIMCILIIHGLRVLRLRCCLPESIIFVFIGATMGLVYLLLRRYYPSIHLDNLTPTFVFVVLIPPIIFESGYNLHKRYFLENFGSILTFAILGTFISCVVVSLGIFLCGHFGLTVKFTLRECFAFGALISAIDPVATLGVFSVLDVDKVLYMLVFGESVLNDAVSISLMNTALTIPDHSSNGWIVASQAIVKFAIDFVGSALIGIAFVLAATLLFKIANLRKIPSLELTIVLLCSYAPYCLADGLKLSGICALLFAGITMSQYTQLNLSPITQISAQQTFRTMAFIAESTLFIYLGIAIFIFEHNFQITMVAWTIFFCLLGRIFNIFPLSFLLNRVRQHKISLGSQFMMWFSGLRGAIAFALSLLLNLEEEKQKCIVSTTLTVVLITIVVFGGSTMPLVSIMNGFSKIDSERKRRCAQTDEVHALFVDWASIEANMKAAQLDDVAEETSKATKFITEFNAKYLVPLFTYRFSLKELQEGWRCMTRLTEDWYESVRSVHSNDGQYEELQTEEPDEQDELLASDLPESMPTSRYTIFIRGYNTAADLKSEIHFVQPSRKAKDDSE